VAAAPARSLADELDAALGQSAAPTPAPTRSRSLADELDAALGQTPAAPPVTPAPGGRSAPVLPDARGVAMPPPSIPPGAAAPPPSPVPKVPPLVYHQSPEEAAYEAINTRFRADRKATPITPAYQAHIETQRKIALSRLTEALPRLIDQAQTYKAALDTQAQRILAAREANKRGELSLRGQMALERQEAAYKENVALQSQRARRLEAYRRQALLLQATQGDRPLFDSFRLPGEPPSPVVPEDGGILGFLFRESGAVGQTAKQLEERMKAKGEIPPLPPPPDASPDGLKIAVRDKNAVLQYLGTPVGVDVGGGAGPNVPLQGDFPIPPNVLASWTPWQRQVAAVLQKQIAGQRKAWEAAHGNQAMLADIAGITGAIAAGELLAPLTGPITGLVARLLPKTVVRAAPTLARAGLRTLPSTLTGGGAAFGGTTASELVMGKPPKEALKAGARAVPTGLAVGAAVGLVGQGARALAGRRVNAPKPVPGGRFGALETEAPSPPTAVPREPGRIAGRFEKIEPRGGTAPREAAGPPAGATGVGPLRLEQPVETPTLPLRSATPEQLSVTASTPTHPLASAAAQVLQQHEQRDAQMGAEIPPGTRGAYVEEWNAHPPHPARKAFDTLNEAAAVANQTNPGLSAKLDQAAATAQAEHRHAFRMQHLTGDEILDEPLAVAPPQVSVWRQLTEEERKSLTTAARRALLVQDISNSQQVLNPETPPVFALPRLGDVALRTRADGLFAQAQQAAQVVAVPTAPLQAAEPPVQAAPPTTVPAEGAAVPAQRAEVAAPAVTAPAAPTLEELRGRYKPGNPFAEKAATARHQYQQLTRPTAHEQVMAESFPVGGGFGRPGGEKRIEQTVNRAVRAEELRKEAEHREAQAAAYDRGAINAQGRRPAKNADAAAAKREELKERETKARAERQGKELWQVRGTVIADSARQFGGNGRKLVLAEHHEAVRKALAEGKAVPANVLADYPDLAPKPAAAPQAAKPKAAPAPRVTRSEIPTRAAAEALPVGTQVEFRHRGNPRFELVELRETGGEKLWKARVTHPRGNEKLKVGQTQTFSPSRLVNEFWRIEPTGQAAPKKAAAPKKKAAPKAAPQAKAAPTAAPTQKVAAKPAAVPEAKAEGVDTTFKVGDQTLKARWAVYDIGDLVTSHTDELNPNPAYPAALQPRERERQAGREWVADTVAHFDPILMGENPLAQFGAPVIGSDAVVESGNGRTIVLRHVYQKGGAKAKQYRDWLKKTVGALGIEPESIAAVKRPVLIRVRTTEMTPTERRTFTRAANARETAEMGAAEQAKVDAEMLTPAVMNLFDVGESGEIGAPSNRTFVRKFISLLPTAEQGALRTAEGGIAQKGLLRARNAVFYYAYGDSEALSRLAESVDDPTRNITNGLLRSAAAMADLRTKIAAESVWPVDIAADLTAAAAKVAALRDMNQSVTFYLAQQGMFGEDLTPLQRDMLVQFDANKRSAKKIGLLIANYRDAAVKAGGPDTGALFEDIAPPTKETLWQVAVDRSQIKEEHEPDLFTEPAINAPDQGSGSAAVVRLPDETAGRTSRPRNARAAAQEEAPAKVPAKAVAKKSAAKPKAAKPEEDVRAAGPSGFLSEFIDWSHIQQAGPIDAVYQPGQKLPEVERFAEAAGKQFSNAFGILASKGFSPEERAAVRRFGITTVRGRQGEVLGLNLRFRPQEPTSPIGILLATREYHYGIFVNPFLTAMPNSWLYREPVTEVGQKLADNLARSVAWTMVHEMAHLRSREEREPLWKQMDALMEAIGDEAFGQAVATIRGAITQKGTHELTPEYRAASAAYARAVGQGSSAGGFGPSARLAAAGPPGGTGQPPGAPGGGGGAGPHPSAGGDAARVQQVIDEGRGVRREPEIARWRKEWEDFVRYASRALPHLPRGAKYAELQLFLIRLMKGRDIANQEAQIEMAQIVRGLSQAQFRLFNDTLVARDMREEVARQLARIAETGEGELRLPVLVDKDGNEIRLTPEDVAAKNALFDAELAKKENALVQEALTKRREVMERIKGDYQAAMESVLGRAPTLDREDYFRHQVVTHLNLRGQGGMRAGELKAPGRPGFTLQRHGSEELYRTDWIVAEHEVLARMVYDTQVYKLLKYIIDEFDLADEAGVKQTPGLKAKARKLGKRLQDVVPEGYTVWQPKEGTYFFKAWTLPDQLTSDLFKGLSLELGVKAEDLETVFARGQRLPEFVIPQEVADTLRTFNPRRVDDMEAQWRRIRGGLMRMWKVSKLISPARVLAYNLKNEAGDMEAVLVDLGPRGLQFMKQAAGELAGYMSKPPEIARKLLPGGQRLRQDYVPPPPELREWLRRGGLQSVLQNVEEVGTGQGLELLARFASQKKPLTKAMWDRYWNTARLTTDWRESIARYAVYLYGLKELETKKRLPTAGASIRSELAAIRDNRDKAWKWSNELLGAYDQVSQFSQWFAGWVPFWRWQAVNWSRDWGLIRNAITEGGGGGGENEPPTGGPSPHDDDPEKRPPWQNLRLAAWIGRKLAAKGIGIAGAIALGKFAIKAHLLQVGLFTWNQTFFPDAMKWIPEYDRGRPIFIYSYDPKTHKVGYTTRLSIFADVEAWFGADNALGFWKAYVDGRMNLGEIGAQMAQAPFQKVASMGPGQTGTELLFGKRLFPSVFKPRPIRDRWEYFFDAADPGIGAGDIYRSLQKRVPAANTWTNQPSVKALAGRIVGGRTVDLDQAAYDETYALVRRFLRMKGKLEDEGGAYDAKANALYYHKQGMRTGDTDAAARGLQVYFALEGTDEGRQASMLRMDPLFGMENRSGGLMSQFLKALAPVDRERVRMAYGYYDAMVRTGLKPGTVPAPLPASTLPFERWVIAMRDRDERLIKDQEPIREMGLKNPALAKEIRARELAPR